VLSRQGRIRQKDRAEQDTQPVHKNNRLTRLRKRNNQLEPQREGKKRTRTCGAQSRAGHMFRYSSQRPSAAWYSYKAHPAWLIPPRAMVHGLHMR